MTMNDKEAPKRSWKFIVIRALGWGIGAGIGLGLVAWGVIYWSNRPKGWDQKALVAKRSSADLWPGGAEASALPIPSPDNVLLMMHVDIENRTGLDVTLPDNLPVMQEKKGTGSLSFFLAFVNLKSHFCLLITQQPFRYLATCIACFPPPPFEKTHKEGLGQLFQRRLRVRYF